MNVDYTGVLAAVFVDCYEKYQVLEDSVPQRMTVAYTGVRYTLGCHAELDDERLIADFVRHDGWHGEQARWYLRGEKQRSFRGLWPMLLAIRQKKLACLLNFHPCFLFT